MPNVIKEMKSQRHPAKGKVQWIVKTLANIHAVIYTSDAEGYYTATAYTRKALKPKFHYRFATRERRDQYAQDWIKSQELREADKVKTRAERNKGHTLELGQVLNTSWGYDQTNVEYYQVVELCGKASVMLREIASIEHDDSHVLPANDSFIGKPFKKRVNAQYNSVKISSCQTASPTRQEPKGTYRPSYRTPFGMGH